MSARRFLYEQLHVGARTDGRLTPLNILLVWVIIAAVVTAVMSTEVEFDREWHDEILLAELVFGVIFLAEYLARIFAAAENPGPGTALSKRIRFMLSPLGIIDLVLCQLLLQVWDQLRQIFSRGFAVSNI